LFWGITFVPRHQLKKKLYFHKGNQFSYIQKEFQKIMTKIETIGTCPKSKLSPKGTNGPLGVKVEWHSEVYCSYFDGLVWV